MGKGKIKTGQAWSTYVLCHNDVDGWHTMSVDPCVVAKHHAANPGTRVERWHYRRNETGDTLIRKEKICQVCYPYGGLGKILNANQWINCPSCYHQKDR